MSVGVEVDALALMLDGAYFGLYRFGGVNVRTLEAGGFYGRGGEPPLMERIAAHHPEWAEVASAILELEAWADWWQYETEDDAPFRLSPLAHAAHRHASGYASDQILLEAAAILRDGWRPSGWKAGSQ